MAHPLANVSLNEKAKVSLDLVVEFLIRPTISEQSSKPRRQSAQIIDHLYPLPLDLFFDFQIRSKSEWRLLSFENHLPLRPG
jgi:hypothetical protein